MIIVKQLIKKLQQRITQLQNDNLLDLIIKNRLIKEYNKIINSYELLINQDDVIIISEENSKLFSDFMNIEYSLELDFNLIIKIVEKIESLNNYFIEIVECSCYIYNIELFTDTNVDAFIVKDGKSKLDGIYLAIIDFINYYNKK